MVTLSIIIPVYNKEKYVLECLDSIFSQNMAPDEFEVICIDDGSTDSSFDIIKSYAKDKNVTLISQKNSGASSARNVGLKKSTGKYVWFIDADDFVVPGVLNGLLCVLKTDIDLFTLKQAFSVAHQEVKITVDSECESETPSPYTWGNIVKREIISDSFVEFNTNIIYGEDTLFWLKIGAFCHTIGRIEQPLYFYRNTKNSIMDALKNEEFRLKQFLDIIEANKELIDFCKSKNIQNRYVKSRIIDVILTYNLSILNSKYICNHKNVLKDCYPIPFLFRIKYFFWYKDLNRTQVFKIVFLPKMYLWAEKRNLLKQ